MPPADLVSEVNDAIIEERRTKPGYDPREDLARFSHYFSKNGFVYDKDSGLVKKS